MRSHAKDTPRWLKKRLFNTRDLFSVKETLARHRVNTVCESGICPNLNECFSKRFVTFLILGKSCTRSCGFCSVESTAAEAVDPDEPEKILEAARQLGLRHVIITSPARDDLVDGGAGQFARVISRLKKFTQPELVVEVLTPDFGGDEEGLKNVVHAEPDIFGHNIETVPRLYRIARRGAVYERSLGVLKAVKSISPRLITKSGIMVGLGETMDEVVDVMKDLRRSGCDILTIGQYLKPGEENMPVERYASPEEFAGYRIAGTELGFKHVAAGPFVRSSYLAEEAYKEIRGGIR